MKEFRGAIAAEISSLKEDVVVCKAAVSVGVTTASVAPKVKVPEPSKFGDKRDAKELDNFIWLVEQYLDALHVVDDSSKIKTTTLYLEHDAILWWRRGGDKPHKAAKPFKPKEKQQGEGSSKDWSKPKNDCFLCGGPHWVRECPNWAKLNAIASAYEGTPQQVEAAQLGTLRVLNAVQAKVATRETTKARPIPKLKPGKAFLFVGAKVNGVDTKALLDSGAN
ncbi:hypothetical protein GH714_007216 [Hevea brasiliensis]|uniref:Retrotransposon gag domain-containing protein n=1 Tax=Hevea brasiliensis TaxID=3981 RepID=A0A6A6ME07_HEVBR|nr:hypothetical protein GH714_007216 [Hevea brasiliensis]